MSQINFPAYAYGYVTVAVVTTGNISNLDTVWTPHAPTEQSCFLIVAKKRLQLFLCKYHFRPAMAVDMALVVGICQAVILWTVHTI